MASAILKNVMEDRIKQRLTGAAIVVALLVLLVPEIFRGRPPVAPATGGAATGGPPLRSYTIDLKEGSATQSASAPVAPPERVAGEAPAPAEATGDAPATPGLVAAAATPAPAPEAAPVAPPKPADDQGDAATRYQVQLGLFASRANADRLAARATREGVPALVSGPDSRGLHRVHTPAFRSRDEAQAIQQKLRELGLSAALTPQR
jgi:cell division septation protein DedD